MRILIVDDAATVRMYHRSILEGAGHRVDEAVNGIEGLEKALQGTPEQPFGLYIVDVNMPTLDGYGFLSKLRGLDLPQVPAIMISTEAQADDRSQAYAAGANAYLIKPARPQELLDLVSVLLGEAPR